jgi:hypothetical protein
LVEFATALADDSEAIARFEKGVAAVDGAIEELHSQDFYEPEYDDYYRHRSSGPSGADSRSIFDDVDD